MAALQVRGPPAAVPTPVAYPAARQAPVAPGAGPSTSGQQALAAATGLALTPAAPRSSTAMVAAARPGYGTAGRPVQLLVNHFKMDFKVGAI